jgi:hypothetical protein
VQRPSSSLTLPADVSSALQRYVTRLSEVDPIKWAPKATHAAFLIQDGTKDPWNPKSVVVALYQSIRGTKELRFYPAGHELNASASTNRLNWLRRQLTRWRTLFVQLNHAVCSPA